MQKIKLLIIVNALFAHICSAQVVICSVQEAMKFAEQNSKLHKLQKENALLNLQNARFAVSAFLPQFDIAWSESDMSKYASTDTRNKNILFSITQTIFNGGKNKFAYDMARSSAAYQYAEYEQSLQNFKASIIKQYYDYMLQMSLVEIRRDLLNNAEQQLAILKSEYELGMRIENDYLEYSISVMKLRDVFRQTERDMRMTLRALKILLGEDVDSDIIISRIPFPDDNDDMLLEPYAVHIWNIIKRESLELQKNRMDLYFSKKQLAYSRRVYFPEISLTGSISFSGTRYPLTEPSYSIKMNINFQNNPFLPLQIANGYGIDKNGLNNVSNSMSASGKFPVSYFISRKMENISLAQQAQNVHDSEVLLHETVLSMIASHDDCIDSIKRIYETLELYNRRLTVSKMEVDRGELKRIDYLEELEKYAEEQINLAQAQCNLVFSSYEIELLANIQPGGLKHVCLLFK